MAFTTRHTVLGRIRMSEELGWEEFVAIYEPLIRLRGRDRSLRDGEIDDLVQDVLLEIYKGNAVARFDPDRGCRFRDYLRTIIDRCAFKMLNKQQKRAAPLGDDVDPIDQAPGAATAFEDRWNAAWRKHVLRQAEQAVKKHVKPQTWLVFERTVLVLDNASYHTSIVVAQYLREMTDTFEVAWLPPYCPELNDIERLWKYIKGSAMANYDFGEVGSLREAVGGAFEELNGSEHHDLTLRFRDPLAKDLPEAA